MCVYAYACVRVRVCDSEARRLLCLWYVRERERGKETAREGERKSER